MSKTKRYYAQRIIDLLQNDHPNQDFKIDERDVFLYLDDVVNRMAENNYFENWKFTGQHIDEQFITGWEDVAVTDQENDLPSYFTFPSNYAALPNNRGIDEIYPMKYQMRQQDHSVVIMSHSDYRRYKNLYAANLEGRLGGYPKGNRFYFTTKDVKKKYGNMGVRLVIRSSADIAIDAVYPIPANRELEVIQAVVEIFMGKREQPTDKVRDGKDQA